MIIGVHAPEFEFEKKVDNIKTATAKYGIHYPVAVDSDLATWTAFNNQYWPAHYLIDKNGQVVYTHFGEGDYDITENNIRYLLGINGGGIAAHGKPARRTGSARRRKPISGYRAGAAHFSSKPTLQKDIAKYTFPEFTPESHWALERQMVIEPEKIRLARTTKTSYS